VAVLSRLPDTN